MQLAKRLDRYDSDIAELKSDVSILKSDVSILKSEVSVLKADVSTLKSEVQEIKVEQHRQGILLEENDTKLDQILEIVQFVADRQRGYDTLSTRIDHHEVRLSAVERTVQKNLAGKP